MLFFILTGFFFTKQYDTLSDLPDDIQTIAVFEIKFDKRIHWADSDHQLSLHRNHRDAGLLLVDDRDFEYMQRASDAIMKTFQSGQRFSIIYGKDVVSSEAYQTRLSSDSAIKSTETQVPEESIQENSSNLTDENIGEESPTSTDESSAVDVEAMAEDETFFMDKDFDKGDNFFSVLPYHDLRFNKKQRREFASKLDSDVYASIHFTYFYVQRFSFGQSFWRTVNPVVWFENVGVLINAKEKHPNSLGLAMTVKLYNKKGERICHVQYFSLLEQDEFYRLPGYAFHLYPSLIDKIDRTTAVLINNADDFQNLPIRLLSPAYHVKKN